MTITIISFILMTICWFMIGMSIANLIRLRKVGKILKELKSETTEKNVKEQLIKLEILNKFIYFIK